MTFYASAWVPMPYASTTRYAAFGALAVPCPPGQVPSNVGTCAPPGTRSIASGAPYTAGVDPSQAYERDTDGSGDDSSDASSSSGGGGASSPAYDSGSSDSDLWTSVYVTATGVGVVGLIAYWFYTRVS